MTWPHVNVLADSLASFQLPQVVSVQTLYPPRIEKATCSKSFALKNFVAFSPFVLGSPNSSKVAAAGNNRRSVLKRCGTFFHA